MLLPGSESARLIELLPRLARAAGKDELEAVLSAVEKHRPGGYRSRMLQRRQRYLGKQRSIIEGALRARFPQTFQRMPVAGLNYLRLVASQDAGVYAEPPERFIIDEEGGRVAADDPEAVAFAALLDDAGVDAFMVEAERAALAMLTLFVRGQWMKRDAEDPGRASLQLFWPSDVGVICHASNPTDFERAMVLVAEVAGPGGPQGGTRWFELWSRTVDEDELGAPLRWGPWTRHVVSDKGDALFSGADGRAVWEADRWPWACLQVGQPSGSVFVDAEHDLDDVVDALNVWRSNEQYTLEMQGHTQLVYAGHTSETTELIVGPDAIAKVGPNETLSPVDLNPKLQDMREARKLALRELAATRQNSPDAYATEPGPPLSGVSRMIANQPHDQRLAELRHTFRLFEERQLLPMLQALHNAFAPADAPAITGTPKMTPRRPAQLEDPEAKVRRLQAEVDAGWITPAQAAVDAGRYPSVDAAVTAGVSNALKGLASTSMTSGLFSLPLPTRAPTMPVANTEGDAKDNAGTSDQPAPAAAAAAASAGNVAATALNGAQVASLLEVIGQISTKNLPASTGREILIASFPGVDVDVIDRMLAGLRGFTPPSEVG